jgi:hypothetical protein
MSFPLTRFSRAITRYSRLPFASGNLQEYAKALSDLVTRDAIDVIVPTCEEVFHVSQARSYLPAGVHLVADEIAKLKTFHDKHTFMGAAAGCGIGIPRTVLIRSRRRLAETWETLMSDVEVVYKRVFSRFGEGTLVKPGTRQVDRLQPTQDEPWIAQEFIEGDELCAYSVAREGAVKAIAVYRPIHRVGKGAGICFERVASHEIEAFIGKFVARHRFTGQISFDFIVSPDRGAFVIECNPRATSGVHLLPDDCDWDGVFLGTAADCTRAATGKAMVSAAMCTVGLRSALSRARFGEWRRDFTSARDAVWRASDPLPAIGQFVATSELLLRAAKGGMSPLAATTSDIEWNGQRRDV